MKECPTCYYKNVICDGKTRWFDMTQRDPRELTLALAIGAAALGAAYALATWGKRALDRVVTRFSDHRFFNLKSKK